MQNDEESTINSNQATENPPSVETDARLNESTEADLRDQLQAAQAKAAAHYDAFVRARAETDNVRRRAVDDVAKAHKFAIENFAEALLPVRDALEAALADQSGDVAKLREGVELTLKQLVSAFERGRIQELNPVGEKFDPNRHQSVSAVPAPEGVAPNHVVNVFQKGYVIAERVLRPALVTVAQS